MRSSFIFIDQRDDRDFVTQLTIQSIGYVDDDLRVDINGGIVSDTKLNVSAYYGETIGGRLNFNTKWQTAGFRKIVLKEPNAGRVGDVCEVYGVDVGGSFRMTTLQVTVKTPSGNRTFMTGRNMIVTPPGWPPDAFTLPGKENELNKLASQRSWNLGAPPIYVPNAKFIL